MFTLGDRIELPAHYDYWMRGARFGTVVKFKKAFSPRPSDQAYDRFLIKMDNPRIKRLVTLPSYDWEFARII